MKSSYCLGWTLGVWLGCGAPLLAADTKPNILFILTDDHRWDCLGCYGNDGIRTPHFDRLAREGARLDAFIISTPLCCPSRAAFLTGMYGHQNGVGGNVGTLREGVPTVASYLAKAGYVTGFVGKSHLGDPRKWGFQEVPVYLPEGGSRHENPTLTLNGKSEVVQGLVTPIFTEAALRFIDRHQKDRWFLWLATTAPHLPLLKDPKHPYPSGQIKPPPGWPKNQPLSNADWAAYYSTISHLDEQVGRVLAKLDELGLAQDTLVFMAGDNGYMFGSHGQKTKSVWFEESARAPALARWPGRIKPKTTVASPISNVDFLPTVLEIAGLPMPRGLESVSMMPVLTGGQPLRRAAHANGNQEGGWEMIRTERWKYVQERDGPEHLYDLMNDPSELVDLIQAAEHDSTRKEMRKLLEAWRKATPKLKLSATSGG